MVDRICISGNSRKAHMLCSITFRNSVEDNGKTGVYGGKFVQKFPQDLMPDWRNVFLFIGLRLWRSVIRDFLGIFCYLVLLRKGPLWAIVDPPYRYRVYDGASSAFVELSELGYGGNCLLISNSTLELGSMAWLHTACFTGGVLLLLLLFRYVSRLCDGLFEVIAESLPCIRKKKRNQGIE